MKIFVSRYELEPLFPGKTKRQGALLKVGGGYADCFVWPELGDLPLDEQLKKLAGGELTPITQNALEWAKIDEKYRCQGKSFFNTERLPQSHFLIPDLFHFFSADVTRLMSQGYTHVKVKGGRFPEQEAERLLELFRPHPLALRLDFNESLTPPRFVSFLKGIERLREKIDFIEDPFPFDPEKWEGFQAQGWTLACDRQAPLADGKEEAAAVLILKPAVNSWRPRGGRCIVTSYLGHPLGQTAAAVAALQVDPFCHEVHGLHSHLVYAPTVFSRHLQQEGPWFRSPGGTGAGFDRELTQLQWNPL